MLMMRRPAPPDIQAAPHALQPARLYAQSLRVIAANHRDVSPDLREQRTCHTFWGFYLAPGARLRFALDDGSEHQVEGHRVTLVPPWLPFRHRFADDDCPHCFVLVELPCLPPALGLRICQGRPLVLEDVALVQKHRAFAATITAHGPLPALERALHGQVIASLGFLALLRQLSDADRQLVLDPDHETARLRPAIDHIDAHLGESIAVNDLAQAIGVSEDHCTRLFKRHLGQTPVACITARRIERATLLLADTDLGLDHIAIACGFATRQYLARQFRRHLGVTPGHYRQKLLDGKAPLGRLPPEFVRG
ncbi:MAG TPA: AraC family transcriptional regulator [Planctomycetota bacterium]|nr:AraC family transcriptional regulator [Planctomycetota bacterium]